MSFPLIVVTKNDVLDKAVVCRDAKHAEDVFRDEIASRGIGFHGSPEDVEAALEDGYAVDDKSSEGVFLTWPDQPEAITKPFTVEQILELVKANPGTTEDRKLLTAVIAVTLDELANARSTTSATALETVFSPKVLPKYIGSARVRVSETFWKVNYAVVGHIAPSNENPVGKVLVEVTGEVKIYAD